MLRRALSSLAVPLLALAVATCADAGDAAGNDGTDAIAPDDLKGDSATGPSYVLVDPDRPLTRGERGKLVAALKVLGDTAKRGATSRQRRLAAETLARLAAGDVRVASIGSARGRDLWHMCKDLEAQPACAGAPPTDPTWSGDAALRAAVLADLDGYMWGDRLYFRFDSDVLAADLAATLVHETNHVLNRSECSYYSDYYQHVVDPTGAWLEEYRAFVAECVERRGASARASRCDGFARGELEARDYGLTPDLAAVTGGDPRGAVVIAESLFADDGTYGWLAPTAARWPGDFGECEAAPGE